MGEVYLSILVGALFLWVPGTLFFLALRKDILTSLSLAPIISIFGYSILGAFYGIIGVFSTWMNICIPVVIAALAAFIASIALARRNKDTLRFAASPKDSLIFVGYLAFGLIIVSIIFLSNLSSVDSVLQEYDNIHHLGVLRSFVETGRWSFIDVSAYGGIDHELRAIKAWGFYPTTWHLTGALLSSSLGISIPAAANITNALYVALVYPAGMFLLLKLLFKDNKIPLICGIFISFTFAAFPWKFMIWGPLFPNLASYALLPGVIFTFLIIFKQDLAKNDRVLFAVIFFIGVITLTITQTNAVFTMAVFLIPFVVLQASHLPLKQTKLTQSSDKKLTRKRIITGLVALIAIGIIWVICLLLPFLHDVVREAWPPMYTLSEALGHVLLLSFNATQPQILLGALLVVGIIYTLRHRNYLWISISYALMCLIFLVCSTSSGIIKQAMGGFWYTDTMRLAASAALYAVPLVCLALSWIINMAMKLFQNETAQRAGGIIAGVICIGLVLSPVDPLNSAIEAEAALKSIAEQVADFYGPADENVYTDAEREFVEQVMEITGDSLILNVPDDGSALAYGVNGLDVFYRYTRTYGKEDETAESRIIREHLNEIATSKEVQNAVDVIGADYILKLDQGDQGVRKNRYLFTYDESLWEGIDSIDDDTPGLELVLSEDDMRLYKIIR